MQVHADCLIKGRFYNTSNTSLNCLLLLHSICFYVPFTAVVYPDLFRKITEKKVEKNVGFNETVKETFAHVLYRLAFFLSFFLCVLVLF